MHRLVLWHAQSVESVLQTLRSSKEGLSTTEIEKRFTKEGSNRLPNEKPLQWWILFFRQFMSPMIFVLAVAAIVTALLKEWTDTSIILGAVFINTIIGFVQELKANRALEHLHALIQPKAVVRRHGVEQQILASEIVTGDILLLQTGDHVTADARLIQSVELMVSEAMLSGESQPIKKQTRSLSDGTMLAERSNMVYAGTSVIGGKAMAIVVATGMHTQIGQIAKLVSESKETVTPLQQQLIMLAKRISLLILILIAVLFLIGPRLGYDILTMLKMSVALAVAAVPEGLVISVTIILAIGMHRILLRRSLVRRLVGAETLGSISVICSDKTGTLTEGEMRVTHVFTMDREFDFSHVRGLPKHKTVGHVLQAAAWCNNADVIADGDLSVFRGSPTDRALFQFVKDLGFDVQDIRRRTKRSAEIPFDSQYKYLATAHEQGRSILHTLSGAPERLLNFCSHVEVNGEKKRLTKARQKILLDQMSVWSAQGFRLIGFANKDLLSGQRDLTRESLGHFVFLGIIGLSDPVRPEAKQQILEAKAAGVRTIIVTGDHPNTARAIAIQVGLSVQDGDVVTGEEMDRWSDAALERQMNRVNVFARVEPRHKLRIIHALQSRNEVVAMMGDGVNDAPALKAADIGVAVGSGTEAAKHVADLVLLDNNLGTITSAIEQGRVIFDNIRKTTVYLISGSFTEIILIAGTILLGLPLPLIPAQILWINLMTDTFPNIGLTLEPAERDLMKRRPRPRDEAVLNPEMMRLVMTIGVVVIAGLAAFYFFLLGRLEDEARIRTFMFAAVGLDTLLYVFAIKSLRQSIFRVNPFSNPWLLVSVCISFVLLLIAFIVPFFQTIFEVTPLSLSEWLVLLMIAALKLFLIELIKESLCHPFFQKFVHSTAPLRRFGAK